MAKLDKTKYMENRLILDIFCNQQELNKEVE